LGRWAKRPQGGTPRDLRRERRSALWYAVRPRDGGWISWVRALAGAAPGAGLGFDLSATWVLFRRWDDLFRSCAEASGGDQRAELCCTLVDDAAARAAMRRRVRCVLCSIELCYRGAHRCDRACSQRPQMRFRRPHRGIRTRTRLPWSSARRSCGPAHGSPRFTHCVEAVLAARVRSYFRMVNYSE